MEQAEDFRAECRALAEILMPLDDADFATITQFKAWSVDDVIGHLHMFNVAAELTLRDGAAFRRFFAPLAAGLAQGNSLLQMQAGFLDGLAGARLRETWLQVAERTADQYAASDPKLRLKWAGPDMSARSAITARQMETWAHGQEIFDVFGIKRTETDRIRNIAHLGVQTFGWSFANRNLPVPEPPPFVELTAPSGAIWRWGEPQTNNLVSGSAVEFAQVVTQARNIDDTTLTVRGKVASDWMRIAQCFAGPPETPPKPGTRFRQG